MQINCKKCQSDQLMFVAGASAIVMVACKGCGYIEQRTLTPELKAGIQAKMAPVDPWKE